MGRMVKRLSGLEIDEISLVDRPANQHGTVVIAKNHQEEDMPQLFDADENPVDESELQVGDFVYDEAGNEFQVRDDVEDDSDDDDDDYASEFVDEGELAGVGKGLVASGPLRAGGSRAGLTARGYAARGGEAVANAKNKAQPALEHYGRNKRRYQVGGAAAAGAAGGYGAGRVGKSAGRAFLEEIGKAFTDDDRDAVFAKAVDRIDEVSKRNSMLEDTIAALLDGQERKEFTEVAKSYGVPVPEEDLGGFMQRAAHSLPPEDLHLLDRILTSHGEISKMAFTEQGIPGGYGSGVLEGVYGIAGQVIQKSAELGMTQEAAVTAVFDANPEAYEEYLAETAVPYNYGA